MRSEIHVDGGRQPRIPLRRYGVHERVDERLRALRAVREHTEPVPQGELARELPRRARRHVKSCFVLTERLVHSDELVVERDALALRGRRRDEHLDHLGLLLVVPGALVALFEQRSRAWA